MKWSRLQVKKFFKKIYKTYYSTCYKRIGGITPSPPPKATPQAQRRFLAEHFYLKGWFRVKRNRGNMSNKRKITAERRRLKELLDRAEVPQQQQDALAPVLDNMAWQRIKLDETREKMQDASVVCHYSNGGGQEGERENPIFKAYINLWRAYMIGLEKFTSYLPKEMQEEVTSGAFSVLEQVKNMKKAN